MHRLCRNGGRHSACCYTIPLCVTQLTHIFDTSRDAASPTRISGAAAAAVVVLGAAAVGAVRVVCRRGRVQPRLCQQRQDLRLKLAVPAHVEASAALQTQVAEQRVARDQQIAQEVRHRVDPRVLAGMAQAVLADPLVGGLGRLLRHHPDREVARLHHGCRVAQQPVKRGGHRVVAVPLHVQLGRLAAVRGESVDVQSVQTAHSLQNRADPADQLLVDSGAGREVCRRAEGATGSAAVIGVAAASRPRLVHAQSHPGPEGLLHLCLALLAVLLAILFLRLPVAEVQEAVEAPQPAVEGAQAVLQVGNGLGGDGCQVVEASQR